MHKSEDNRMPVKDDEIKKFGRVTFINYIMKIQLGP